MAKQKRPALGKGIGALLSSAAQEGGKKYFSCPIEDLKPHHRQPRKTFDDGKDEIIRKKLSVRETEKLVKKIKNMFGVKSEKASIVKPIDPNVLELENNLRQQLGTQVKVHTKNKGGRIEISYHDQTELSRILELLGI